MAEVKFEHVDKVFDNGVKAVSDMTLDIRDGEFLVLVGPSGCGKTTALRMVAGLEAISNGTVSIGDKVVNDLTSKDRDIAMVFQNYALYPHLSVADNIAFGLRLRKEPKEKIAKQVEWAAKLLDLVPYLDRRPKELSGGQRQRVAMGRAIVRKPEVFLMDEPLSNLDAKLRVQTRTQVAELQRQLGVTTIYVTHDQVEAMTMGSRIAVLKDGVLQQVAAPQELFSKPVNMFVAGFIGSPAMNMIEASPSNGAVSFAGASVAVSGSPAKVIVGVRPEGLEVSNDGVAAVVEFVEELGSDSYVHCSLDTPSKERVVARAPGLSRIASHSRVSLRAKAGSLHAFDAATGLRISA